MSTDPFETASWNFPISNRRTLSCLSLQVTITDPQTLRVCLAVSLCKSLMQLNYREMREMTNLLNPPNYNDSLELANSLDLLNSVVQTESGEHVQHSGSPEHYLYSGSANILVGCIDENQNAGDLSDLRNEKGSTANAALWYHSPDDIGSVHYKIVVVQKKTYENFVGQPMGSSFAFLRWRRLISPLAAVTKKPAVLSPSYLTSSIASRSSSGSLTESCRDLLFFLPVAITEPLWDRWCSVCTKKSQIQYLTWCSPRNTLVVFTSSLEWWNDSDAPEWWNTTEAPNHNVTRTYTMAYSHSTQTHPEKHLWRFLALDRADMNAIPRRVSVEAPTEHDARLVLAPYFILSLAARLPAQGVCNV